MMNKRVSTFVALALIATGAVCGLSVHHEDVRSDAVMLTPYSMISGNTSGILKIGDETYPYAIVDSAFGVDLIQDDRSHCWVMLSFSRSYFGPYNNLRFEFWTLNGTQAPEGSSWASTSGSESKYIYDDSATGTKLMFHLVNNMVDKISFKGTTMNEYDGDLEYVTFDIEASFDKRVSYVNRVIEGSLPEAKTLIISGKENGRPMSGTLDIVPVSCIIWNGGKERIVASATLNISGTSIPNSILTTIVELNKDYEFISRESRVQYLDHEGKYIDQEVKYRLSGGNDSTLILDGTITSSTLDSKCRIIEQTTFEFSYEAVR